VGHTEAFPQIEGAIQDRGRGHNEGEYLAKRLHVLDILHMSQFALIAPPAKLLDHFTLYLPEQICRFRPRSKFLEQLLSFELFRRLVPID
jgi:hypothetical protein